MARNICRFQEDLGEIAAPGFVVHPGDITLLLGIGATAIPFAML
jgi:hypothetical protein